jgi:methyl-accepting chemotaxis protein PixJ
MTDSQYQPPTSNTDDCVSKIIEASSLEKSGQIEQAIALYQQVLELDRGGNYGAVAEKSLANLQKSVAASATTTTTTTASDASWWAKLSLRWKVTGLAIALSTIPLIGIGATAYYLAGNSLSKQVSEAEIARTAGMMDKVNRFMIERYGDIQIIAKQGIFINPAIRDTTSMPEKIEIVDNYLKSYAIYDSIAAFDLEGNVLVQSTGGEKLGNHKERDYFQQVIKTKEAYISQPTKSQSTGVVSVYMASPIIEKGTNKMTGVVRARMPVKYIEDVISNFNANGEEYHLIDSEGNFFVALETEQVGRNVAEDFPGLDKLRATEEAGSTITVDAVDNQEQLVAYSPSGTLEGLPPLNWEGVIGIDTDQAFAAKRHLLLILEIGLLVTVLGVAALATYLSYKGTAPILKSTEAVKKLGQGNLDIRTEIKGSDELAELGSNINLMAEQLQELLKKQEAEAWKQRQEKETLQTGVMNLLLDVEGAQKGDLTVQAKMSEGAVGSIADAFNATINRLRRLLEQVQTVSTEVGQLSQTGESSVRQLSDAALTQAEEIDGALGNIAQINESVENVAKFAQEAAQIAREGLIQAKEGDRAMDETVNSIEKIRTTVAGTSKKAKQLAESSQEIAQIVDIISGISEKTNLLAFNASVEAARAGEHGEGFRIVAEEVRRLADRITESTKDIQQLVSTIQQDTTSVLQGMETSTTEVVNGSELIRLTKQNLRRLAQTNENINQYLQSISSSTTEQTNTSRQVNEKITGIATIARNNSTEAQDVLQSLRTLVQEAETLQSSVSQFKLKA